MEMDKYSWITNWTGNPDMEGWAGFATAFVVVHRICRHSDGLGLGACVGAIVLLFSFPVEAGGSLGNGETFPALVLTEINMIMLLLVTTALPLERRES